MTCGYKVAACTSKSPPPARAAPFSLWKATETPRDALDIALLRPWVARRLTAAVEFDTARSLGEVWALNALWKQRGGLMVLPLPPRGPRQFDVEALLRLRVQPAV